MCLISGITNWARLTDSGMARMEWGEVVRAACFDGVSSQMIARLAKLGDRDRIVDLELRSPVRGAVGLALFALVMVALSIKAHGHQRTSAGQLQDVPQRIESVTQGVLTN
jgi:hypothetical protein